MGNFQKSLCSSLLSCETDLITSPPYARSMVLEEKNTITKESFKMSCEDLKISHHVAILKN